MCLVACNSEMHAKVHIPNHPFKQPVGALLRGHRILAELKDDSSVFGEEIQPTGIQPTQHFIQKEGYEG